MILINLAIVIFWGVLTAYVAEKKGRNRYIGLLLGIFLGVLAFIGYLLLRKVKKCPYCEKNIPYGASVCLYCGREV